MVRYIDDTRQPRIDFFIKDMEAVATGLQNRPTEAKEEFPAHVQIEGDSLGGGHLHIIADLEPLADKPHFHVSVKLTQVNLPALNDSQPLPPWIHSRFQSGDRELGESGHRSASESDRTRKGAEVRTEESGAAARAHE